MLSSFNGVLFHHCSPAQSIEFAADGAFGEAHEFLDGQGSKGNVVIDAHGKVFLFSTPIFANMAFAMR